MGWGEFIEAYLEDRGLELSPKSLAVRGWQLGLLREYAEGRGLSPRDFGPEHLTGFHQRLLWEPGQRGALLSRSSVYGVLKTTSLFFRWAVTRRHLLLDPLAEVDLLKPRSPFPRVPTVDQVRRLLEVPDPQTAIGARDRAILEILYSLGLRRRECHGLEVTDFFPNRVLCVRQGKGRKDRLLPISPGLFQVLDHYLKKRPELRPLPLEKALFVSPQSGQALGYESLRILVQRHARRAGLKLHPHALRHACAVHLLEGGADVRHVQELLGHTNLTSTQLYTRLTPQELHTTFRKTHPRARRQREDDPVAAGLSQEPEE